MNKKIKGFVKNGLSIQYIIAITTIIVAIIPMLYIGLSIYEKYSNQIIENSKVTTTQILEQLKNNIEEYLARGITGHNEIENLIVSEKDLANIDLITNLNMYLASRNDIVSISLFDMNGKQLLTVPRLVLREKINIDKDIELKKITDESNLYYISKPHIQQMLQGDYRWVISFYKVITSSDSFNDKKQILAIDVSMQPLVELCNDLNLGGSGYVYIVDEQGNIIYHPQQAVIFSGLKRELIFKHEDEGKIQLNPQGEEVLIVDNNLNFVNWNLVGISYVKNISDSNIQIAREMMVILPIILLIVILISFYSSYKISLPIKELSRHMEIVEKGNFDIQLDVVYGEREVMNLTNNFNVMVKRVKELIIENRKEQDLKRHNELDALQAQINPHFLYNTLDSITWMAEAGMNEEVVEMVTALSRLFRISISKGHNIITVKEELEHARNYLLIQKIRYKDKFQFYIHANDEVLQLKTIKLILQPLIENSIYHGIEYMVDMGEIHVSASIVDEKLLFIIRDNGLGMSDRVLKSILNGTLEVAQNRYGNGVGARNVDSRVKLRYGLEYGLEITSEEEVGTEIKIWQPISRGDEHEV